MKRLAWLTDIHLNFLDESRLREFLAEAVREEPDAVLITGDIAEAPNVAAYLKRMEEAWRRPVYFVLGNHDFYRGSVAQTRRTVTELARQSEFLVYLTAAGAVALTPETALVGHDGWGDARLGDYLGSDVLLNDFFLIEELKTRDGRPDQIDFFALRRELERLGDEAGAHFARTLGEAMAGRRRAVAATHVPPFREAAWHQGRPSNDDWLPFFSCKAAGDAMLDAMAARPDCDLLVLCGHTHGGGEARLAPNLRALTGEARYGQPRVQTVLEIE